MIHKYLAPYLESLVNTNGFEVLHHFLFLVHSYYTWITLDLYWFVLIYWQTMASHTVNKNRRTHLERIEKFLSPRHFVDVNLYSR